MSVLLFANENAHNPGRLFTLEEWGAFVAGYVDTAPPLTAKEVRLWPEALKYMRLEWGTWHLTEGAEWDLPGQGGFLRDLLTLDDSERFPLHLQQSQGVDECEPVERLATAQASSG